MTITKTALGEKYTALKIHLDKRTLRLCAAADARSIGRGGISFVSQATGISRATISAGLKDLDDEVPLGKIRRAGAGRKPLTETNPDIMVALEKLVDPATRGDPESPLCWTSKSTTKLARDLTAMGHRVSQRSVWNLLIALGYSMQSNRKANEGSKHPDRDAQFQFISNSVATFLSAGLPAISVETKKKELIGNYKNGGEEWERKGTPPPPQRVNTYDFADKKLGKVSPCGGYDIAQNKGWVSVGISKDTAEFAVESIRRWWYAMGQTIYSNADHLLITADGGGSNIIPCN